MSATTAVASQPHLGFDGVTTQNAYLSHHTEEVSWDVCGPSSEGFRGTQTQQGFDGPTRSKFLLPYSETTQWDRYGAVSDALGGDTNLGGYAANRGGSRTKPIITTFANVSVGVESHSSATLALDTPALAFEHVLASLARLEARIEASERNATIAQPPPRPDPDPPYTDWQRG
ncbi:hypothetical protein SASPL_107591 [Salvia splendens]|uniref:Uncharacterized protein n=1 Tax=Salvia splendens TaxID=180675 RepID=A0A8X9A7F7_SALSN|nr:hypothetical protein SASPL_107591 [Salvia splendens]